MNFIKPFSALVPRNTHDVAVPVRNPRRSNSIVGGAFVTSPTGSLSTDLRCASAGMWNVCFRARIANNTEEAVFCSAFGESVRGLEALDPPEFAVESHTTREVTIFARRRLRQPVTRAIVSLRNNSLHYAISAAVPPLELWARLLVGAGAVACVAIAALVALIVHPILTLSEVPDHVAPGSTVVVGYNAFTVGNPRYVIQSGSQTVASGPLPFGSGSISFAAPTHYGPFTIALDQKDRGSARRVVRTSHVEARAPEIRAIEVEKTTVTSGDPIVIRYDLSAEDGDVALIDSAGIPIAHAPLNPTKRSEIAAPKVATTTPYRVVVHAMRGDRVLAASTGVIVTPKAAPDTQSLIPNAGAQAAAGAGVVRIEGETTSGGPLNVRVLRHPENLHLALQDDTGATIAEMDVDPTNDNPHFTLPAVPNTRNFALVVTYADHGSEQTLLVPFAVRPL